MHYLAQSAEKMEINGAREKRDNDVRGEGAGQPAEFHKYFLYRRVAKLIYGS